MFDPWNLEISKCSKRSPKTNLFIGQLAHPGGAGFDNLKQFELVSLISVTIRPHTTSFGVWFGGVVIEWSDLKKRVLLESSGVILSN